MGLFFVFAVLAGGLAFGGAFVENLPIHIFATATVALYGLVLYRDIRKNAGAYASHHHANHPESVYIVGYIATIGGFAGLAVYLGQSPERIQTAFVKILPMILERGGFAVISTLVGLVMMNILKMVGDGESTAKQEQEEFAGQIATEIGKSLGSASQTTTFTENVAKMRDEAVASVAAIGQLKETADQVKQVMQAATEQMPPLLQGLTQFKDLGAKIFPAWEKLGDQAEQAVRLHSALAGSAQAMEAVRTSASASSTSIAAFAEALPGLQGQLTATLADLTQRVGQIQTFCDALAKVIQLSGDQMPKLVVGLGRFEELGNKVLPAWEKMGDQVAQAERLNAALAASAESLVQVNAASKSSTEALTGLGKTLPVIQDQFSQLLVDVRQRLDALNQFSTELTRFLEYSRQAAPVITEVRQGFGDIVGIHEKLELLSQELQRLNTELTHFREGTMIGVQASQDFGNNIKNLSLKITHSVTELAHLSKPMEDIGKMAEHAATASDWFNGHADGVQRFKDHLTDLMAAAEGLKTVVVGTQDALTSSNKSVKELELLMPQLAKARLAQLEKL